MYFFHNLYWVNFFIFIVIIFFCLFSICTGTSKLSCYLYSPATPHSDYCNWEYQQSGLYNFPNMLALLTHNSLLFHHFGDSDFDNFAQSRSLNAGSISPDSDLFLSDEDRLRLDSLGLIGKNLFKEMIIRQLTGFYQFYQKAREIIGDKPFWTHGFKPTEESEKRVRVSWFSLYVCDLILMKLCNIY